MSKESPTSASTQNAVIEESVRETQGTVRTIVAYIEEVHGTTLDLGSATPPVIRSEPSVPDVKTTCQCAESERAVEKRWSSSMSW